MPAIGVAGTVVAVLWLVALRDAPSVDVGGLVTGL